MQDVTMRKIGAITIAIQAGLALTGVSYMIGNLIGFGAAFPNDIDTSKYATYDEFMAAWVSSIGWQFAAYLGLLVVPKFFIYKQSLMKKKRYMLFIYLVLPWLVAFSLDGLIRMTAFTLIAALAVYEGLLHQWVVNPPLGKK